MQSKFERVDRFGAVSAALCAAVFFAAFLILAGSVVAAAQTPPAKDVVSAMVANERNAGLHPVKSEYISVERSDRTGGHLWTEKVVETQMGRVHFLLADENGPLSPERVSQERGRLANDLAHPDDFAKREAAQKDDEAHARQMLESLERGFVLENMREAGPDWAIDYRPDPAYSPSSMEDHVLHGMTGSLLIDRKQLRLHHVEGRLTNDVSIGFGLLATVKAGSHFMTTKEVFDGDWRTVRAVSDIHGKAALFKTLTKNQDVTRSGLKRVPFDTTLAQAIALAELP